MGARLILHFDYESRGVLELEDVGVDKYFSDPRTEILMCAYAFDDGPVKVWEVHKSEMPRELREALISLDVIKAAWNASFERTGTEKKLDIFVPFEQWYDPSVGARHMSMPGGLDRVGEILDLPVNLRKNAKRGEALVNMFCKPIPTKKRKAATDENTLFPVSPTETTEVERVYTFRDHISHPVEWAEFVEYCRQDVVAERAIGKRVDVFPLEPQEQKMWFLDQKINHRGMAANKDFATKCFTLAKRNRDEYTNKLRVMTGLDNPNSNDQMLSWVTPKGYPFTSLRKEPVRAALTDESVKLTDECRAALDILKYSKKTSYTKLEAITTALSEDGRLRDQFLFYGSARAGRWTGRNVQFQNMARPIKNIERKGGLEKAVDLIFKEDYDGLKAAFPNDPIIEVMTSCIRSSFVATPGNRLDVCDLNAIENRVLGWVADEQAILDVFRKGRCPYLDFASFWFNIPYATIEAAYESKDPDAVFNRQISKPAVLGCGYRQAGGGWGTNKKGDRVKTGLWKYAEDMFCPMTQDQAHEAVHIFRTRYKKVVNLWYDVERAVARCIKTGTTEWLGPTKLVWCDRRKRKNGEYVLRIHLPSGRCLHYLNAHMEQREQKGKDGSTYVKDTIIYEGIDQVLKIWTEITTHGGKLVENIVQAIARDILVHGMLLADEMGLFIVAHVHDEIVTENPDTPEGLGLEDLAWCMSQVPSWALGLPLEAKGWSGYYYKK
jgi:DNA polymerase bacteriophage-type